MEILIGLIIAALVIYVVYRKLNKVTDESLGGHETPVAPELVAEPVLEEAKVAAVVEQKEKKPRKKASSAAGAKKSVKKIKSVE